MGQKIDDVRGTSFPAQEVKFQKQSLSVKEKVPIFLLFVVVERVLGQPGESLVHAERVLHLEDINARIAEHLGQEDFHDYSGQPVSDSLGHLEINVQRLPVHVGQPLRIHLCQIVQVVELIPLLRVTWKSKEGKE